MFEESREHEGEAKTPSGSIAQKGKNYQDAIDNFEKKGFTNIKTKTLEDLITGWITKDGEVESVTVDGNEDYSPDVWYPNDVEVVITYHTFPKDDEKSESTASSSTSRKVFRRITMRTQKRNLRLLSLLKLQSVQQWLQ